MTRKSFWNSNKLKKDLIGVTEHYLVHLLRETIVVKELNLVAVYQDSIVGHIMLSNSNYVKDEESMIEVLCLGPLTVDVKYQRCGIGKQLMIEAIKRAKDLNYPAIILYGHPEYYPKFGFNNAQIYHISTSEGKNFDAFMALELSEGALDNIKGNFILNPIYDESSWLEEAIEYDKKF